MSDAAILWQGAPSRWPAALRWCIWVGVWLFWMAVTYVSMSQMRQCIHFVLAENCRFGGMRGLENVFFIFAFLAAGAALIALIVAFGFPFDRYRISRSEIKASRGWLWTMEYDQPTPYASISRSGNSLRICGVGEKGFVIGPLSPAEADIVEALIRRLKDTV